MSCLHAVFSLSGFSSPPLPQMDESGANLGPGSCLWENSMQGGFQRLDQEMEGLAGMFMWNSAQEKREAFRAGAEVRAGMARLSCTGGVV